MKTKKEQEIGVMHQTNLLRDRRIVSTGEITPLYSHFLCFTVTERTNALAFYQDKYTQEQEELHALIRSLHEGGLGYRKIAHHLNANGVKTVRGNNWGASQVHSILKRYKERETRKELIKKDYEPVWGRMRVEWMKN